MKELIKIAETFELDLAELKTKVAEYKKLTLIPDDKESFQVCRSALTTLVRTRTALDKRRKELNSDAQKEIKERNDGVKRLAAVIEPAETHLKTLVDGENNRLEAIKKAEAEEQRKIVQSRVDELIKYNCVLSFLDVAAMSETEYSEKLEAVKTEFKAEEKRKAEEADRIKSENERLEKQRKEQEEAEQKIKAEQEKIEADKKEFEENQRKEKEKAAAKLKEEQDKIEADKKAIEDEKREIELEKAKKEAAEEARIKAQADLKEKTAREAMEKIEREEAAKRSAEREEMLKPDKQKLDEWISGIGFKHFTFSCEEAHALYIDIAQKLDDFKKWAYEEIEKL